MSKRPRGPEAQRPRGPRYPKGPKHTETPLTRCYHNEDLIPTELSNTRLDLRGPEAQRPRGLEAQRPRGPEAQRPKIPRGPKSPEAQRPRAPKAHRPKRPEAQEAHTSPTNVYPPNLIYNCLNEVLNLLNCRDFPSQPIYHQWEFNLLMTLVL